jgi:nicotinamide-nucleotide amidase
MENIKAEIISIGTELIIGHTVNTNATYISEKLAELGISVHFHTSVGDNEKRIAECIDYALNRSDLIIFTGGLGPTDDDITHDVIAKTLGLKIEIDLEEKIILEEKFNRIGVPLNEIPQINYRQARTIFGAQVIKNPIGTAIGIYLQKQGKTFVTFPGVPCEMEAMLEEIKPKLIKEVIDKSGIKAIVSTKIRMTNITESFMAQTILNHYENLGRPNPFTQSNPSLAPYATIGEVYLRVTASAETECEAKNLQKESIEEIKKLFPNNIFGYDKETLANVLAKKLKANKLSLSFAESCTGGLAAKLMTDIPGSSAYMNLSLVAYSNSSKISMLAVKPDTIEKFGAVSKECAKEMVEGLSKISNSNINISITGIAGPDGATDEKPIGTIFVGIIINQEIKYLDKLPWKNRPLSREQVRETACKKIFWELIKLLDN